MNKQKFQTSLSKLVTWIEKNNFKGYDPYDALNSDYLLRNNKWMRLTSTVFFRISPINFRKIFKIKKGINPKAMGLLLSVYSHLSQKGIKNTESRQNLIFDWLLANRCNRFSGYSWGYNFPWQNSTRLLDSGLPSVVTTAYVANGMLDYYISTQNSQALFAAEQACNFVIENLNKTFSGDSFCFSYTPIEKNIVHNANVLGASLLSRVSAHNGSRKLREHSTNSIDFTIDRQNNDGSWDYCIDPITGKGRVQTDWHQGFILDALADYIDNVKPSDTKYSEALLKGALYYKNKQFDDIGRCHWRLPQKWPIDIHNQAQGIITFSRLFEKDKEYLSFASKVANWTINEMQDEEGFFYFQKWPFFINKIPYIRWSQAWMAISLTALITNIDKYEAISKEQ